MKRKFNVLIYIVLCSFLLSHTYIQIKDCKCKNIELKGRVKIVTSGADLRVKVVDSFPDLRVKKVTLSPVECGEWQFVDSGEDFTIQWVNEFPDLTIKYVDVFPGMN